MSDLPGLYLLVACLLTAGGVVVLLRLAKAYAELRYYRNLCDYFKDYADEMERIMRDQIMGKEVEK